MLNTHASFFARLSIAAILMAPLQAGAANSDDATEGGATPSVKGVTVPCPESAPIEVFLIPYARSKASFDCESVFTVLNLGKVTATVTCEFLDASGTVFGSATLNPHPGWSQQCVTNPDPLGLYITNASMDMLTQEGSARICSSTKKIAVDAKLVCSTTSGPMITDLNVVLKKQKGD